MKKILLLALCLIFLSNCYAQNEIIEINGVDFELPAHYQGGELYNSIYRLDNIFSLRCVDDNVPDAIGLWAEEADFSEDLIIDEHPVRHFCQYNSYVKGNHSHAYFLSNQSVYEISWNGSQINDDIEKLIKNTPQSEINKDDFYNVLNESYNIYKVEKINKLDKDSEYNYLESKYHTLNAEHSDNTKFKEILLTYYNH